MSKNDRYVIKQGSHWAVKAGNATRVSGIYATQGQAERAAKKIVRNLGDGEVRIQGRDGRWRDSGSYNLTTQSSKQTGTATTTSKRTPAGRIVWHVTDKSGRQLKLTTSRTSNTVIQEGASIYDEALKSLAKR